MFMLAIKYLKIFNYTIQLNKISAPYLQSMVIQTVNNKAIIGIKILPYNIVQQQL
jgi:hypothetical protein